MVPNISIEDLLSDSISSAIEFIYAFDFDTPEKFIHVEKALSNQKALQNQVKEALHIIVNNFKLRKFDFLAQFINDEDTPEDKLFAWLKATATFPVAGFLCGEKTMHPTYIVPTDTETVPVLSFDQFCDKAERECLEMEFESLPLGKFVLYAKYESAPCTNKDRRIFLWTDHLRELAEETDGVSFKVAFIYAFYQVFAYAILDSEHYYYCGSRVFEWFKEKSLASGIAQYMISKTDGLTLFDHLAVANLINNLPATNEIGTSYANEEVLKVAIPKWKAIAGGADINADAVKEWYKAVARKASVQELIEIENAL